METQSVYRGNNSLFFNSECMFIEYHDVLRSPWFMLLLAITHTDTMNNVFDLTEFEKYNIDDYSEWYMNRRHRNFLYDLKIKGSIDMDELMKEEMKSLPFDLYQKVTPNFFNVFNTLIESSKDLVKSIIIYNEYYDDKIIKDIDDSFPNVNNIHFMFGEFSNSIKNVPNDTTYIFSDIDKITLLNSGSHLNYSSILLSDRYQYNYKNTNDLKINIEELRKSSVFKFNRFNNTKL